MRNPSHFIAVPRVGRWLLVALTALTLGAVPGNSSPSNAKGAHWAFQPVQGFGAEESDAPGHPPVAQVPAASLDAVVARGLSSRALTLAPEADRPTLLRRLALDLTGLPPSPAEVDAFVADTSPAAYDRVVERLLASPHYGEKWARWWLDAARYADSNGFEKDRTRSIWPYRDWVIGALNQDLPFDQFTREQLAGDLLPNPTLDQRIATGFLRNSMVNMEGGIEPEKFRVESIIDRVDCVGRTWLGLTIACAQCHEHKYDPIPQADYYRFFAFFNQDSEPRIEVPTTDQQTRRSEIVAKARAWEAALRTNPVAGAEGLEQWETQELPRRIGDWKVLHLREWHSQPMKYELQEDGSLLGGGDVYNHGVIRIWADVMETNITGFRLEALNSGNLPFHGPGLDGNGQFQVCEFTVEATPLSELSATNAGSTQFSAATNLIRFSRAIADQESPAYPASGLIDGNKDNGGWGIDFTAGRRNEERRAVLETDKPFGFVGGTRLLITLWQKPKDSPLSNQILGRFRLSFTTQSGPLAVDPLSERQRRILAVARDNRSEDQKAELLHVYHFSQPALAASARGWDELWKDWPGADNTTLAMESREPVRTTRIFKRGDWQKPLEAVSPAVPQVLPPLAADAPPNRLGLANWLVDPRNPLTSRVIVNRVWQAYFGQGLVITSEDFGTRAEKPVYPELLDGLASEFMTPRRFLALESQAGGPKPWSLKHLHRTIVHSRVYRQSSRVTPELAEQDPANRWLARASRFRLDAEGIQDVALKVSGLLSPKIGGPSVFPPLPDGVMAMAYGQISWNVSEGEDRYRRALYTFWKRSVPYPALTLFDAPQAEQSCVRRVRSNTPLQALVTLNEPTFNQAARWLAWRALNSAGPSETDRVTWIFRQCLGRQPTVREVERLQSLWTTAREEYAGQPRAAADFAFADPRNPAPLPPDASIPDLAAWSVVSRAVLNLDEALTRE